MGWSYNLRKDKPDRRASSMTSYKSGTPERRRTTTVGLGSGENRGKTDARGNNKKSGKIEFLYS